MNIFILFLLFSIPTGYAQDKEEFRSLLKGLINNDPVFQETDLQTPIFDAQVRQGFSQLVLPKIGLTYGYYEQSNSGSFIQEDEYRIGSLTASLNLFSFGSDWSQFQSARIERKAQNQRVETRLLERERDVASLVLNFIKEARNLEILKKLVELKVKALDLSRKRFEKGSLSEEDYSKVKLDVSNARGELLVSEQNFNATLAQVRAFGAENLPVSYPWETDLTGQNVEKLLQYSTPVEELPQFQAAEMTEIASDYRKDAFRNIMLGRFNLNFSRSVYDFESRNLWEWRTSLVYTLPLFDSFDQYVEYKRNDVSQQVNQVRKRFQKNAAASNQEAEKMNLRVSWKNWSERRDALKLSSRLYNGSLSQFNQGRLSVNELLVDQDRLLRTELIANLSLFQLHGSMLAFCHSQGKAFVRGCF